MERGLGVMCEFLSICHQLSLAHTSLSRNPLGKTKRLGIISIVCMMSGDTDGPTGHQSLSLTHTHMYPWVGVYVCVCVVCVYVCVCMRCVCVCMCVVCVWCV